MRTPGPRCSPPSIPATGTSSAVKRGKWISIECRSRSKPMQFADSKVRRVGLLVLGLALAASANSAAAQWIEQRPFGEGYKVEFPAKPEASQQEVQTQVGAIRLSMLTAGWSGLN